MCFSREFFHVFGLRLGSFSLFIRSGQISRELRVFLPEILKDQTSVKSSLTSGARTQTKVRGLLSSGYLILVQKKHLTVTLSENRRATSTSSDLDAPRRASSETRSLNSSSVKTGLCNTLFLLLCRRMLSASEWVAEKVSDCVG